MIAALAFAGMSIIPPPTPPPPVPYTRDDMIETIQGDLAGSTHALCDSYGPAITAMTPIFGVEGSHRQVQGYVIDGIQHAYNVYLTSEARSILDFWLRVDCTSEEAP